MDVNLVLFKKNGSRKDFHLREKVTLIGRRQDCDLCIPLMAISRRHCELRRQKGELKVRDLSSTNGTYVNGKRVEQTKLKAGDYIQVGPITFGVQLDGKPRDIKIPDWIISQSPKPRGEQSRTGTFAGYRELDLSEGPGATEFSRNRNNKSR